MTRAYACLLLVVLGVLPAAAQTTEETVKLDGKLAGSLRARETAQPASTGTKQHGSRHVVILVGLPGDAEHQELFEALATKWKDLLENRLQVSPENIHLLGVRQEGDSVPATGKAIAQLFARLSEQLVETDAVWIFFLGHANYDGQQAFFHLPGRDLAAGDYRRLLEPLRSKEQVVWMTTSSSGWFLEPLSRAGRVTITATSAAAEPNETELPLALASALAAPVAQLDRDADGRVCVLELFAATVAGVRQRYEADQRAPTENAMLDDNGDGRGSSWQEIELADEETLKSAGAAEVPEAIVGPALPGASASARARDGDLARSIVVLTADVATQTDDHQTGDSRPEQEEDVHEGHG